MFSIFPCFCIGNPGRVPRSWSPFLWPLGAQTLIYWAALEMGEGGGGEQVTAPELGNEAQNEGLSASGRALGYGVVALPPIGHVNMPRITQGDSLDPCVTPLGENNTRGPSHALLPSFGTLA